MTKQKFDVFGMTCAACQAHVEKAVKKLDGIKSVSVNLLKNNMTVEFDDALCTPEAISKAVSEAGYGASLPSAPLPAQKTNDYALAKLIASIILLLVLMYFSMGNMMWGFPAPSALDHEANPVGFALIQFVLVLPILAIYRGYFVRGYKKLLRGKPNMDTLIAVGATASLLYGLFALFMLSYAQAQISAGEDIERWASALKTYSGSLYFESAGMILTLVSLGKFLEGLSKKRTTVALTKLMDLAPKRALLFADDKEVEIAAEDVKVGDILIVKNGASVPVDGIIVEGRASIDQSNITGESIPVQKQEGDEVYSSTLLTAGYFKMRATKVGEDTSIASIIRLVDEASNSKAPISRLVDKISGVFVPIIFAIAIITFIVNLIVSKSFELSLNFAITVVVIACPCALGLATPVSIMAGTGKGAQNGLLVKNAEILEKAHLIKTVVFDKTGTITEGNPAVTDFVPYLDKDEILSAIFSIEHNSEHPLALAISKFGEASGATLFDVQNYVSVEGGLKGEVRGANYVIGNAALAGQYCTLDSDSEALYNRLASEGKTPLVVIKDDKIAAIIALKDTVKEGSAQAVKALTSMGMDVIMLTGDNEATARVIAGEVGINHVLANVKPSDKHRVIEELKSDSKHLVAMVGDGVNDAPALTAADIGIAIGGGSDVAMECSDIVLLRKNLMDVVNAISLSRRVLNTIKLGLFWAFFYNCVCVLIATGAFYYSTGFKINPMIGALAMSVSSVSVVLNALTINFFKGTSSRLLREKSRSALSETSAIDLSEASSNLDKNDTLTEQNDKINLTDNVKKEDKNMKTYVFKIEGMMCNMCEKHVANAIKKFDHVIDVLPSHEAGTATVTADAPIDLDGINSAIRDEGYTPLSVEEK